VLTGGAIVFFTYIGFDSVSTAAEEARNPQKDIPSESSLAHRLHHPLRRRGAGAARMMKYSVFGSGAAAEAPVAYALQQLGARPSGARSSSWAR